MVYRTAPIARNDANPRARAAIRTAPWALFLLVIAGLFAVGDPPRARPVSVQSGSAEAFTAPPGLRAAYIATRQAEGARDPQYAFRADPGGATFSAQTAGGLHADVARDGVAWSQQDAPWRAHLAALRYGCSGALAEVDRSSPPRIDAAPNRVGMQAYAGGAALEEWYVNGPLGLDQGWTLRDSPCAAGDAERSDTELEVGVRGLEPAEHSQGPGIDLRDAAGTTRLHYSDLSARDADGKELASSMDVADGRIVVRVQTRGARFPVVIDPLTWPSPAVIQVTTLGGASYFGSRISVSGNTAIIGASQATSGDGTQFGGVVYYYSYATATGWTLQQTIQPPAPSVMAQFGAQVAVSGSVMAVAQFISGFQGAVYVYTLSGNAWSVSGNILTAPAPDGMGGDGFGASSGIAISGTTVIVGASGLNAAYVFNQSGPQWSFSQKLTPPDSSAQAFGGSVAASNNTLVVGAFNSTGSLGQTSGAAYAYSLSGSPPTATYQASLFPPANDLGSNSTLGAGTSVAIAGSTIFVGAPYAPIGNTDGIGAVYVYTQSGATFAAKVSASDVPAGGAFGNSVAASGPNLVVGTGNSKIYVFTGSLSNWTQALEIGEPNGSTMDQFGGVVSASGPNLLVGAACYLSSGGNCGSGAVYAGLLAATNGSSCTAGSDCQSTFCVTSVCCPTACNGACATGCAAGTCGTAGSGTACGMGNVCNGSSQACPTSCTGDTGCASGYYCAAGGTCQARKATGATCNTAAGADCQGAGCRECASGGCVDGYCCSTASCSGCMACAASLTSGVNGTCSNVTAGNDPHNTCGGTMACNGANMCALRTGQPATGTCASGFSKDGYCCDKACGGQCQVCSGALGAMANGACTTAPAGYAGNMPCGSGIACDGTMMTCPGTACTSDANCVAGYYCASTGTAGKGSCALQRTLGAACNVATGGDCESPPCSECGSKTCVDNVCCGSTSCLACMACSTALAPGGTNGTCSAVPEGTDPHALCTAGQTCNGTGACKLQNGQAATAAAQCASGNLANGVCCNTACGSTGPGPCSVCTAALGTAPDGTCSAAKAGNAGTPSCSPLLCDGTGEVCPTTCAGDSNCATGFYCGSDKTCHAQKATGATCNVGTSSAPADCAQGGCHECLNGGCVDGVCCSTPSCGSCQACAASLTGGANGTCSATLAGNDPHGDCASNPNSTCNGNKACGLKNGQSSTTANACASGNLADGVCCASGCGAACEQCTAFGSNPAGTCGVLPSGSAGMPACGGAVCNGTSGMCPGAACHSDTDCNTGFYCGTGSGGTGSCQPQRSQGTACNATAGASGDCFTANCHECTGTTSCVDNVCCGSSSCGVCDSCSAALQISTGTAGMCGPSLAGTDPHSDCKSGSTCNGSGACGLGNGQPATSASACSSGNLSDGVCCDLPCLGSCTACTMAHGATKDGSCTTLPDGTACNGTPGMCESANCVVPQDAGSMDAAVSTAVDGSVADGAPPKITDASSPDSASTRPVDAAIADAAGGPSPMMGDASDTFQRTVPSCSCRVTGTPNTGTPALASLAVIAAALSRRRRRSSTRHAEPSTDMDI